MNRYKVVFHSAVKKNIRIPHRVFFVAAEDVEEAFDFARATEAMLERPSVFRDRTFRDSIIQAVTEDDE